MAKKEAVEQVEQVLSKVKSSNLTIAVHLLAMNVDKQFELTEQRLDKVDEKLDQIINLIGINKELTEKGTLELRNYTEKRIKDIEINTKETCEKHQIIIKKKFEEIDENSATWNYFSKHPSILKIVGVSILIVIAYLLGHSELINKFL